MSGPHFIPVKLDRSDSLNPGPLKITNLPLSPNPSIEPSPKQEFDIGKCIRIIKSQVENDLQQRINLQINESIELKLLEKKYQKELKKINSLESKLNKHRIKAQKCSDKILQLKKINESKDKRQENFTFNSYFSAEDSIKNTSEMNDKELMSPLKVVEELKKSSKIPESNQTRNTPPGLNLTNTPQNIPVYPIPPPLQLPNLGPNISNPQPIPTPELNNDPSKIYSPPFPQLVKTNISNPQPIPTPELNNDPSKIYSPPFPQLVKTNISNPQPIPTPELNKETHSIQPSNLFIPPNDPANLAQEGYKNQPPPLNFNLNTGNVSNPIYGPPPPLDINKGFISGSAPPLIPPPQMNSSGNSAFGQGKIGSIPPPFLNTNPFPANQKYSTVGPLNTNEDIEKKANESAPYTGNSEKGIFNSVNMKTGSIGITEQNEFSGSILQTGSNPPNLNPDKEGQKNENQFILQPGLHTPLLLSNNPTQSGIPPPSLMNVNAHQGSSINTQPSNNSGVFPSKKTGTSFPNVSNTNAEGFKPNLPPNNSENTSDKNMNPSISPSGIPSQRFQGYNIPNPPQTRTNPPDENFKPSIPPSGFPKLIIQGLNPDLQGSGGAGVPIFPSKPQNPSLQGNNMFPNPPIVQSINPPEIPSNVSLPNFPPPIPSFLNVSGLNSSVAHQGSGSEIRSSNYNLKSPSIQDNSLPPNLNTNSANTKPPIIGPPVLIKAPSVNPQSFPSGLNAQKPPNPVIPPVLPPFSNQNRASMAIVPGLNAPSTSNIANLPNIPPPNIANTPKFGYPSNPSQNVDLKTSNPDISRPANSGITGPILPKKPDDFQQVTE